MITLSSAWFTMYISCSGKSRRFSVCSTAPMLGTARYATMCSALFHISVPTRSSPVTPRLSRNAWASRADWAPIWANEVRRGPSAVQVMTSAEPWTVLPCSSKRDTCRGVFIIVLRMPATLRPSSLPATVPHAAEKRPTSRAPANRRNTLDT